MAPETPAAPPSPLRHLAVRIAATLLVVLVLYALSSGPMQSYRRYSNFRAVLTGPGWPHADRLWWLQIHGPLDRAITDTFLEKPYRAYVQWWLALADRKAEKELEQMLRQRAPES